MWGKVGLAVVVVSWALSIAPALAPAARASGTTIDSFNVDGSSGTFAECGNVDVEHNDQFPSQSGSGPFSANHTFSPADSAASCGAGSGTDHTSGSLSSGGDVDANGGLTLIQSSQGTTTTTTNYVGDPANDCLDVGLDISSSTTVDFTIAQPMPYNLSGTTTSSGSQTHGSGHIAFSLTGPGTNITNPAQVSSPNLSGTLQPGAYEYKVNGFASNDLACDLTGSETDTFAFNLTLRVGTLPAPRCKVTSTGKVTTGLLPVKVKCDQAVSAKLKGSLTDKQRGRRTRHFQLAVVRASLAANAANTLKLRLPAAAFRDLQHGASESAALTLSATSSNGSTRVVTHVPSLRS